MVIRSSPPDNHGVGSSCSEMCTQRTGLDARDSPSASPRSSSDPTRIRSSASTRLPTASTIRRTWRLRPSRIVIWTSRSPVRRTRAGAAGPSARRWGWGSEGECASTPRAPAPAPSGPGPAARPAGAQLGEGRPDDLLERRDLLADRRLAVAELAGRRGQRALLGDRLERKQVPQLDAEPPQTIASSFHRKDQSGEGPPIR